MRLPSGSSTALRRRDRSTSRNKAPPISNPTLVKTGVLSTTFVAPSRQLNNRVVMAPMTRSWAMDHNMPKALMAKYQRQRVLAGLIVTEATSPSPIGCSSAVGYLDLPGLTCSGLVS